MPIAAGIGAIHVRSVAAPPSIEANESARVDELKDTLHRRLCPIAIDRMRRLRADVNDVAEQSGVAS